jgi:iron(III) transport system substrate-binding protein
MSNKRWLISFMAILLPIIILATACGNNNNATPEVPKETPKVETPAAEPAAPVDEKAAAWEAVLEAAKKEKLVIATGPGQSEMNFFAEFQKAYPDIKVEQTGIRPTDIAPKVITEQENNKFLWDIMSGSTSTMNGILSPAGAFQEMAPFIKDAPNYDDANWHGPLEFYANDKNEILVHSLKPYMTIYVNREHELAAQFNSVDDLVNPVFKGKIVIDTPAFPTYGSINLAGVLGVKGEDFVKQVMIDQEPVYMDNIMTTTDWLGEKRYPIAIGADEDRIAELNKANLCLKCEPLNYGKIPMLTQGIAIFKNAPNPNAAKVFANWIISKEGQEAYNNNLHLTSRRVDVENQSSVQVDWATWQDNELIGTEEGSASLNTVIATYKALKK